MVRVASVTGGTRGIGAAICKALKKAGYNVAANYGGNDEAAKVFKTEARIQVYKWDVTDCVACEQGVVNVENEVGQIEVLVNNAGITRDGMLPRRSRLAVQHDAAGDQRYAQRNFGRIINISSINGQKGQLGIANYCAAKAGVLGFTKAVTLENARKNVTVNAIAPGYINTGMFEAVARGSGEEHPCLYPNGPSLASLCIGLGMGVAMGIER